LALEAGRDAYTAIVNITQRCNQHCSFCLEKDSRRVGLPDPSTEEVFAELAKLWEQGARQITFMGGETLLRKDAPQVLAEARRLGFTRVGVATNGTALAREGYIDLLRSQGLDFVEFSLHGHTPELANAIAGTSFTFQRQARALRLLQDAQLPTMFNVVACRENKDVLPEIADYILDRSPHIPGLIKIKFLSLQGRAREEAERSGRALAYDEVDAVGLGDHLTARGAAFLYDDFPLCRLGPYAHLASETVGFARNERYFDLEGANERKYCDSCYQLAFRVWPRATCHSCSLRSICPGVEENYFRANPSPALLTQTADPVGVMARCLSDLGGDPASAADRVALLSNLLRPDELSHPAVAAEGEADASLPDASEDPSRRKRKRSALFVFVSKNSPNSLDLWIEEGETVEEESKRLFARTRRFALSYKSSPQRPEAMTSGGRTLLDALADELRQADERELPLNKARLALVRRARANGWILLKVT